MAERLKALGDRIDDATFEERRLAVTQLVEGITVNSEIVDGQVRPVVTITYKFGEPKKPILPNNASVILNRTDARAVKYYDILTIEKIKLMGKRRQRNK